MFKICLRDVLKDHSKIIYYDILCSGERPSSPLVGFLPPNPVNGTDGQGFITYNVRAKKDSPTYSLIDAKASIVFDQNEAIETPPIFNTVKYTYVTYKFVSNSCKRIIVRVILLLST